MLIYILSTNNCNITLSQNVNKFCHLKDTVQQPIVGHVCKLNNLQWFIKLPEMLLTQQGTGKLWCNEFYECFVLYVHFVLVYNNTVYNTV